MFKKILIGLAVIVVALLGFAATKPNTFRIERTASIKAAPETIFAHLNDFRSWRAWSPWEKLDPALQRTYSGAAIGMGAAYDWKGNSDVGAGRMTIVESVPASKLVLKLEFLEPFAAQNTTEFILTPAGEGTKITWAMQGPNPLLSKVMSILFDMDKMVGKDFETGLANLKAVAEAGKQDIVLTRIFEAPLETVWKAWTDPEEVKKWWGPRNFTSHSCTIDFREGGKFVFHMRAPKEMNNADFYTAGVYKKIALQEFIEFTQGLADKDGNKIDPTTMGMPPDFPEEIPSLLAFKRVDGKTELTAVEYGWTLGQMREMSKLGLEECLDKLAENLR